MIEKRIIGVAGLGHVGAHVAFCLGMMGVADSCVTPTKRKSSVNAMT